MSKVKLISPNDEYIKNTKIFTKTDILFSVMLYVIVVCLNILLAKVIINNTYLQTEPNLFYITGLFSVIYMLVVFLFCKIRKQKISTLGFTKANHIKSIVAGVILSILLVVQNINGLVRAVQKSILKQS